MVSPRRGLKAPNSGSGDGCDVDERQSPPDHRPRVGSRRRCCRVRRHQIGFARPRSTWVKSAAMARREVWEAACKRVGWRSALYTRMFLAKAKMCAGRFLKRINNWHWLPRAAAYLFLFALTANVIGAAFGVRSAASDNGDLSTTAKLQMIKAAQRGVLHVLKAPASAEFPSPTFQMQAYSIQYVSPGTHRVAGYVDAQNSFGAMLRSEWEVICKGEGLNWYGSETTFDGTLISDTSLEISK
jgi:hypothetical protein